MVYRNFLNLTLQILPYLVDSTGLGCANILRAKTGITRFIFIKVNGKYAKLKSAIAQRCDFKYIRFPKLKIRFPLFLLFEEGEFLRNFITLSEGLTSLGGRGSRNTDFAMCGSRYL